MEELNYLIIWESQGPGSGWVLGECVLDSGPAQLPAIALG